MIDFIGFSLWFSSLPESTKENLLGPSSETLGKGLNGIISVINNPLIKLGMISTKNLKKFEERLYTKNNEIPLENRDPRNQGLALQCLEDALYRLTEEEMIEYYSSLIANSLDNRKNSNMHPAFSVILKEMSSNDARLFKKLYLNSSKRITPFIPLATMQSTVLPDNGVILMFKDTVILPEEDDFYLETDNLSLSSLERLGLLKINRTSALNGKITMICKNENSESNSGFLKNIGTYEDCYNFLYKTDRYKNRIIDNNQFSDPQIVPGSIELTSLAQSFGNMIIEDN